MTLDKNDLLLYVVTDRHWIGEGSLDKQVEQAILGGATVIQLREKNLDPASILTEALSIKNICKYYQRPFIVNDYVDLALQIDADGIHIGQNDMEIEKVRTLISKNKILGVSVQTVNQAIYAEACGADYLGVGAMFHTDSKSDAESISFDTLKMICSSVTIPVVAIGGINKENLMELTGSGISGIAAISAVFAEDNIQKATQHLKVITSQMITS